MRGRTGPSMKTLPKKLPRNRVTTKYRPLTDTAICGEMKDTRLIQVEINKMVLSSQSKRW